MSKPTQKILKFINDKILLILAGFLVAFIPLYPKIPLLDAIPGYIVRIRLEDAFVFIASIIWLVKVLRKKIQFNNLIFWLVTAYVISAFLSVVSAVIITKTVPVNLANNDYIHLAKTLLHFVRYVEYFSLFFIVSSSIKTKQDWQIILVSMLVTLFAVSIYGIGQKYYYWPVYSTMNREFSKGLRLYLTEHARVQSTFGGHYDFAAYLVILLSLVLALFYKIKNNWLKLALFVLYLFGLWSMIVAASRTSFVAFCVSLGIITLITSIQEKTWLQKIKKLFGTLFVQGLILSVMFVSFGEDMAERLLQVIDSYQITHDVYHDLNDKRKKVVNWTLVTLGLKEFSLPTAQIPENGMSLADLEVLVASDQRPSTQKPTDVYVDVPNYVTVATTSASGSATFVTIEQDRTWSANALKYGLSLGIRLDELWPKAIAGFLANPLLGTGYATLTKSENEVFTEAESTDNNFLRTLGETGLLGFIFFYSVIVVGIIASSQYLKHPDNLVSAVSLGYFTASIGLLLNAVYIDVFAASKVAFTYWSLTGLFFGLIWLKDNQNIYKHLKVVKFAQKLSKKIYHAQKS